MTARPRLRTLAIAALLCAASDAPTFAAGPNSTQLLSRPSGVGALPVPGDGPSFVGRRSVSSDGRLIVFTSSADDLGVGDTLSHVWVRDTIADTTQLVDRVPGGGAPGNGFAGNASISRDGTTVCFESSATNLVPGVTGDHLFVVKLATGAVQVVDRSSGAPGVVGDAGAERCALDATGTRVVFDSSATNLDLVTADTNGVTDVFVRELVAGTTTRVSLGPGNAQTSNGGEEGAISGDGLKVAFTTRADLLAGNDTNNSDDVYVLTMQTGVLIRASVGTGNVQGNDASSNAALDDTGGHVAFTSRASNLDLGGDGNDARDVFWRDLTGSDTTILVSRATGGGAIGDDDSTNPDISGDGLGVAFESQATNLGTTVPPGPFRSRVYLRRLGTNETSMLSRASGAAGAPADSVAAFVSLGSTPTVAVWASLGSNLDPAASGDFVQVFKRDLSDTPTTSLVSRPPGGGARSSGVNSSSLSPAGAISTGAGLVVFVSSADALDPAGASPFPQAYLRDVTAGTTTLLSRGPGPGGAVGNSLVAAVGIAAGGTHVAFVSLATNLLPGVGAAEVGNGQVYVRELATGNLELASRADGADGAPATELFGFTSIGMSADGRRVVFTTGDALVASDTNSDTDVYLRDLAAGTTTLVSVAAGGGAGDDDSSTPSLSADGTRVAFQSRAKDLLAGEPTTQPHVFVRDLVAGTTVLVDRTEAGAQGDGSAFNPLINGAGTRVVFRSDEALTSTPVPSDALYVRDLASQTTLIAARADGLAGELATGVNEFSINHDGTRVSWTGSGAGLPGGPDTQHVYLRDLAANTTRLVSAADGTVDVLANDQVITSAIDPGGGCVAFVSNANNLTTPAYTSRDFQHVYLRAVDGDCPVGSTTPTTTSTTSTTLPSSARTPIPASALVLKSGKLAKLAAKKLAVDLVDPRADGGTLAFAGTTGSASFPLPASGWKPVGKGEPKGFKFKGAGCRVSMLRTKITAKCRGNTGALSLPEPGPVDVELTLNGAGAFCAQCGGTVAGKATKVFKRKRCPAPAACP